MDSDSELISLITKLASIDIGWYSEPEIISVIAQIISFVSSMDMDLELKPESELMSLTTQIIFVFNSMDLDSQPKPLSKLISLISQKVSIFNSKDSDLEKDMDSKFMSLLDETSSLEPEPELLSLIHKTFSLVISMNQEWMELLSIYPQAQVELEKRILCVAQGDQKSNKFKCLPGNWLRFWFTGEDATKLVSVAAEGGTHFLCRNCNGEYHQEHEKAPFEVKHALHPKHSLKLALSLNLLTGNRKCYCCDESIGVFYYCSVCDFAMSIGCVQKPPQLAIDHPKWHEHTLALFTRQAFLNCNVCALSDLSSPIYMCPPCDFVVHLRCMNLPLVIKISRHSHRISFTHSFGELGLSCGVCHKEINNEYGGYSCIKRSCSYAAHSRCATQSNVWDGLDLEGEPEDIEEENVEPFVRISDGVIQHFSHKHHHLRLDDNNGRDYDDNKECQACITPIYFGNLYSCIQCDFIIHEECANHALKLYHPIHPHLLTLVVRDESVIEDDNDCSACHLLLTSGIFYECGTGCNFKVHVHCGTINEPLVNESHMHPLYLTSKPEDERSCKFCNKPKIYTTNETFNCIESCDFSLCFGCATLPQKVRYKHDKHILTLSYGEKEISTLTYWCEICEKEVNPKHRFYRCDEYCCVTLHIDCLIGKDKYMKPGSTFHYLDLEIDVVRNNHMFRHYCNTCEERCPFKIFFLFLAKVYCSVTCVIRST